MKSMRVDMLKLLGNYRSVNGGRKTVFCSPINIKSKRVIEIVLKKLECHREHNYSETNFTFISQIIIMFHHVSPIVIFFPFYIPLPKVDQNES